MSIAFFDLDRTILSVNSGTGWVIREWKQGRLGYRKLLRALSWLAQYRLGLADLGDSIRMAVADLEGSLEQDIRMRSELYWDEVVVNHIRKQARETIEEHRQNDDKLVLLSGTSVYLAERAQKELGLHAILCNRFEVLEGYFTGRCVEPISYGDGKTALAKKYADSIGEELENCYFYTDSYSDLDTLKQVGHPVVICPDQRLRREATRQGWPILDWHSDASER